jgi:prepilin-type processing-associated H-X9-DG protein
LVGPHFGPSKRLADDGVSADVRALNFGSSHPAGANFAMADGSVRFISFGIDKVDRPPGAAEPEGYVSTFTRLGTRDGRETIEDDF